MEAPSPSILDPSRLIGVIEIGKDARGALRYTTREYLEAEHRLLVAARSLASRHHLRLDAAAAAPAVGASSPQLTEEQRRAVAHATTQNDLAQVVGRAGAGKTTAARAIAAAYQEQGYEVRGAALAGKAAQILQAETGIPARTLASLELAWAEGRDRLHARSVLLIDEADMVDVRRLGRVLAHAEERGAKVVLVGDPNQLKAIGAGERSARWSRPRRSASRSGSTTAGRSPSIPTATTR
jgi:ATP-dependent exoDNAse (exonuclease V) alpha subunit